MDCSVRTVQDKGFRALLKVRVEESVHVGACMMRGGWFESRREER